MMVLVEMIGQKKHALELKIKHEQIPRRFIIYLFGEISQKAGGGGYGCNIESRLS